MKHFSFCLTLALGLFSLTLAFQSCQKEANQTANPITQNQIAGSRGSIIYGVTVFSAGNPSLLVEMDGSGAVLSSMSLFIDNGAGQHIAIDDLKGVCWENGRLLVTTGFNTVDAYSYMLAEVKLATGELTKISNSTIGAVSDIDYDFVTKNIYGLANNANKLAVIDNNGSNFDLYQIVGGITNLGANYIAKGLTLTGAQNAPEIMISATTNGFGNAQVYNVPFGAGAATFLSIINPANQLATGHCGIGYDVNLNLVLINRRAAAGFGLNSFAWNPPLGNQTNSAFWGGAGFNFEDLTTVR